MIDTGMPRNAPTFVRGEQNDDARASTVSSSHQAAARLLKRVANGFGMANTEKFAGFSSEVMAACEGYGPITIDAAADMLVRGRRPDIGAVYAALGAASGALKGAAQPHAGTATAGPRSDLSDVTLIVAWLCNNKVRCADWEAEFGPPSLYGAPFVSDEKLKQFALNAAPQHKREIDLIFYCAHHQTERPKGAGETLARRIDHALLVDRHGVNARRAAFNEASGDVDAGDRADLDGVSGAPHYGYVD